MSTSSTLLDDGSPIEILRARLIRALGSFERAWSVPGYADDAVIAASACDDRDALIVAATRAASAADVMSARTERRRELGQREVDALGEVALSIYYEAELALRMRSGVTR